MNVSYSESWGKSGFISKFIEKVKVTST